MSGPLPQEGEKYLVSPWCLCGKEHPCPDHGAFVERNNIPANQAGLTDVQLEAFRMLLWVLRKELPQGLGSRSSHPTDTRMSA